MKAFYINDGKIKEVLLEGTIEEEYAKWTDPAGGTLCQIFYSTEKDAAQHLLNDLEITKDEFVSYLVEVARQIQILQAKYLIR
jgi:hypothetical protein